VDITFSQQDSACQQTVNVILSCIMCLVAMSCWINFQSASGVGGSWPPCSPEINSCDYFFWGYLKDQVYCTNPHNVMGLQMKMKLLLKRSEVTQLTTKWITYGVHKVEGSHVEVVFTQRPHA
jgi:hypothetical protein